MCIINKFYLQDARARCVWLTVIAVQISIFYEFCVTTNTSTSTYTVCKPHKRTHIHTNSKIQVLIFKHAKKSMHTDINM